MLGIGIFSVKSRLTRLIIFLMKKKGFLLSARVVHGKCKTCKVRRFLKTIAQVKMRITLVYPNKTHKVRQEEVDEDAPFPFQSSVIKVKVAEIF